MVFLADSLFPSPEGVAAMSPLQQRMLEDMQLRGLSARTQEAYARAGWQLSEIFRAKFCAALKKAGLLTQVPRQVWKKDWVVHCKAAGQGRQVLN